MNFIRLKYIWFMSLCLFSSQLVSMEKPIIRTADELRTLAFAVEPEDYASLVEKYVIKPSAVTNSVAILLGDGYVSVSDSISQYVQTTCSDDYTLYEKQIIQIMQGYRASNNRQDIEKTICVGLKRKIYEKEDERNEVYSNSKCLRCAAIFGAYMSGMGLFVICLFTFAALTKTCH